MGVSFRNESYFVRQIANARILGWLVVVAMTLALALLALNRASKLLQLPILAQASADGATKLNDEEQKHTPLVQGEEVDLGRVRLEANGQALKHAFKVTNLGSKPVKVVAITTSCGCLEASLDHHDIDAGAVANLTMKMKLAGPGRRRESASLAFDNGATAVYVLKVTATHKFEAWTVPTRIRVQDRPGKLKVRVLVSDDTGSGEAEAPKLYYLGRELSSTFSGWATLEEFDETIGRPATQIGTLEFTINQPLNPLPAEILVKLQSGWIAPIRLDPN